MGSKFSKLHNLVIIIHAGIGENKAGNTGTSRRWEVQQGQFCVARRHFLAVLAALTDRLRLLKPLGMICKYLYLSTQGAFCFYKIKY